MFKLPIKEAPMDKRRKLNKTLSVLLASEEYLEFGQIAAKQGYSSTSAFFRDTIREIIRANSNPNV